MALSIGQGEDGDHAECKEFWGPTLFDDEEENPQNDADFY